METDSPGARVAANVRALRDARRMTVRDLSARMTDLGRPLLPSGITKVEQGLRRVDVDELVALAVALGVSPSRLLLPADAGEEDVALTPTQTAPAWAAWQWAAASQPLPTHSAAEGYNTEDEVEDFRLHSLPPAIRRQQQHPLMQAINRLTGTAPRVIHHAMETKDSRLLADSLSRGRRYLQAIAGELDVLEEEAASRGER